MQNEDSYLKQAVFYRDTFVIGTVWSDCRYTLQAVRSGVVLELVTVRYISGNWSCNCTDAVALVQRFWRKTSRPPNVNHNVLQSLNLITMIET